MAPKRPNSKWEGIRLAVVSGLFVLIGIALGDRVSWYGTAFFGLCFVTSILFILGILPRTPPPMFHLSIDDIGVTRTGRKLREHVAWADLVRVRIFTNDQGPYAEDVFFVLEGKNDTGCVVPHDLAVQSELLEALHSRLEGVDNGAVIEAMLSVENRIFTIWEAKDQLKQGEST